MKQLLGHVTIETIGAVEISTVDLSDIQYMQPHYNWCETCLFWGQEIQPGVRAESDVVQVYPTWEQAQQGHAYWMRPENVAKAIHQGGGWEVPKSHYNSAPRF